MIPRASRALTASPAVAYTVERAPVSPAPYSAGGEPGVIPDYVLTGRLDHCQPPIPGDPCPTSRTYWEVTVHRITCWRQDELFDRGTCWESESKLCRDALTA